MVESYFNDVVGCLFINQAISSFKILRKEVSEEDGYIRIKCKLLNGDILEFSEYIVIHKNKVTIETYSYHWQKADGTLIKRWDNVSQFKEVDTFPHHLHLTESKVVSSPKLTLKKILDEIEKAIIAHDE